MPITRKRTKWHRNWPCLCGSGKKYKVCCIDEIESITALDGNANIAKLPENIQKMINAYYEAEVEVKDKQKGGKKTNE